MERSRRRYISALIAAASCAVALALLPAAPEDALGADQLPFEEPKDPSALPRRAVIETTKGTFEIMFFREDAPLSVRNFEYLAKNGTYDFVKFHKYMDRYSILGGDPTGTGRGGPGYTLPPEFSRVKHIRGTMGWARPSMKVNPERRSSGSQFYIMLVDAFHLDGFYSAFARVVSGMEVVDQLRVGDRILSVTFPADGRSGDRPVSNREKGANEVNELIRRRALEAQADAASGRAPRSLGRSPEEEVEEKERAIPR